MEKKSKQPVQGVNIYLETIYKNQDGNESWNDIFQDPNNKRKILDFILQKIENSGASG